MARLIIGSIMVAFSILLLFISVMFHTLTPEVSEGYGLLFWIGLFLIWRGNKARRKVKKEVTSDDNKSATNTV